MLSSFPDTVAALAVHGHVTKTDYDSVLIPDVEARMARHKKVRIYCEIAEDLAGFDPGAVWADSTFGFGHFFDWERRAVVRDVEWVRHVAKFSEFVRFPWPGEYRAFSEAEAAKAREWR